MIRSRLLCAGLLLLGVLPGLRAQDAVRPIASPSGRSVFFDSEPILLRVPCERKDGRVDVVFRDGDGRELALRAPVFGGVIDLTMRAYALTPAEWEIRAGRAQGRIEVVSSIVNTPFRFAVYGARISGNPAEPLRLWRDTYGINWLMMDPAGDDPARVDGVYRLGARFTGLHDIAAGRQPGEEGNDWSEPGVLLAARHSARHRAQLGLKAGPAYRGLHIADEPGLGHGFVRADGRREPAGPRRPPREAGDYLGPFGHPAQAAAFRERFGRDAPDSLRPELHFDGWLEFQRWRATILGDFNAALAAEVKAVHRELLAYSQQCGWERMSDGVDFRDNPRALDLLCVHSGPDSSFLGPLYGAFLADAARPGHWDRDLLCLPMRDASGAESGGGWDGSVRAILYATLARKVEGIGWMGDSMQKWPQAAEVMERILPVSAMLHQAGKRRDPVAVLHSRDQHLAGMAADLKGPYPGWAYPGRIQCAWATALAAGYPACIVTEEDLLDGTVRSNAVVMVPGLTYARPEILEALRRYVRQGGAVLRDESCTVSIEGAERPGFEIPNPYALWLDPGARAKELPGEGAVFDRFIRPNLYELRRALERHARRLAACDNPHILFSEQAIGQGRLVWVVDHTPPVEDRPAAGEPPRARSAARLGKGPARLELELPRPAPGEALYDVFAQQVLPDHRLVLGLDRGDARLYAYLPQAVRKIEFLRARWAQPHLKVDAIVQGNQGIADAALPLRVDVIRPDRRLFATGYRAARAGRYIEDLSLGGTPVEGNWRVRLTEQISGVQAEVEIFVRSETRRLAEAGPVLAFQAPRIREALRPEKGEVLVLYGDEDTRRAAERIVRMLRKTTARARADDVRGHLKLGEPPARGLAWLAGRPPTPIDQQVVVIGAARVNPLMARLVDEYGLAPIRIGEGGAGSPYGETRALLFWATGAFGLAHDIVAVYADDATGLDRAVNALTAIVGGDRSLPESQWLDAQ